MINPVARAAIALRERRRAPDMAQIMSALPVPVVLTRTFSLNPTATPSGPAANATERVANVAEVRSMTSRALAP